MIRNIQAVIFAGTADGRKLAEALAAQGVSVLLWSATDYGAQLADSGAVGLTVGQGRMNAEEMRALLADCGCKLVVDATHPYATEVTLHIRSACAHAGVHCIRLLRPGWRQQRDGVHTVATMEEAAAFLAQSSDRALLTVGSKELAAFASVPDYRQRFYVRVLPTVDSLEKCGAIGFSMDHIIAMQGPFSHALNVAMLRDCKADWLVTKDSGEVGGFYQKLSAAEETGVRMLLIGRPVEEEGLSLGEAEHAVLQALGISPVVFDTETGIQQADSVSRWPRFPLFVDLAGAKAVLVGAGPIAERRAKTLLDCGAAVTVIAPAATSGLAALALQQAITLCTRPYRQGDLQGAVLAVAATDDRAVNRQVGEEAKRLHIPHSAADDGAKGDFWFPAMVYNHKLCAGIVSMDGNHKAVKQAAKQIREEFGK